LGEDVDARAHRVEFDPAEENFRAFGLKEQFAGCKRAAVDCFHHGEDPVGILVFVVDEVSVEIREVLPVEKHDGLRGEDWRRFGCVAFCGCRDIVGGPKGYSCQGSAPQGARDSISSSSFFERWTGGEKAFPTARNSSVRSK
jgi:hypothetical protein